MAVCLQNMQRGGRNQWHDEGWGRSRGGWKQRGNKYTGRSHSGDGHDWEVEEGEIAPTSEGYPSFEASHVGRGDGWQEDYKRRNRDYHDKEHYSSSSAGNREDRRGRASRNEERSMLSKRWDYNSQGQGQERWGKEEKFRMGGESEMDGHHSRRGKATWRGDRELDERGTGLKSREHKSSSRHSERRLKEFVPRLTAEEKFKSRNIVCHSISGGSSHQESSNTFSTMKREQHSPPEQGKRKRQRTVQSTSRLKNSPKKAQREASHSLEQLEDALRLVEKEEQAVSVRNELKAELEEMKKKKLTKAEEGLGQQSILVKDFPEMDEYFGKFGVIVGITKVGEGSSQIDFVNASAAEKAKKSKDLWPKDSQEYEATRSKSLKPRTGISILRNFVRNWGNEKSSFEVHLNKKSIFGPTLLKKKKKTRFG